MKVTHHRGPTLAISADRGTPPQQATHVAPTSTLVRSVFVQSVGEPPTQLL